MQSVLFNKFFGYVGEVSYLTNIAKELIEEDGLHLQRVLQDVDDLVVLLHHILDLLLRNKLLLAADGGDHLDWVDVDGGGDKVVNFLLLFFKVCNIVTRIDNKAVL